MHLHAHAPRIQDGGLVRRYHRIDPFAQGTVHDSVHGFQLIVVENRIDRQIGFDTVLPGDLHDTGQVVEGKVGRRTGTHVQLSHAEIYRVGAGRYGRPE